MIALVAAILATALDPLRLVTAIGCGFIRVRMNAWIASAATSVAWTLFAAVLWHAEQRDFSITHLVGAIISSLAITSFVHWIRNRGAPKSLPNEVGH
jgi:hypothetical protein